MNTVPNQRIITVCKAKANKNNLYTTINLQALNNALHTLKSIGGIKLFFYIASNQDKYQFALSRQDFMNTTGCAETAYRTGFKELVDNKYLVEQKSKGQFIFYEWGNIEAERESETVIIKKKESINQSIFSF